MPTAELHDDTIVVSAPYKPNRAPANLPHAITVMSDGMVYVVRFPRIEDALIFRQQDPDVILAEAKQATADEVEAPDMIDAYARPGRTGYRLKVKEAKERRARIRVILGSSRDDTPAVVDLLDAAAEISSLLIDATEGEARVVVDLKHGGSGHAGNLRRRLIGCEL